MINTVLSMSSNLGRKTTRYYDEKIQFKKIGTVGAFVLPAMIPLIVFWIYPILMNSLYQFTDWDYMMPEYNFVGVQNLSTFP